MYDVYVWSYKLVGVITNNWSNDSLLWEYHNIVPHFLM